MSHLPIQHKNETTPGRAVSRLTVVKVILASQIKVNLQLSKWGMCRPLSEN